MNTTFLQPNKTAGIIFNKVTHHSLVTNEVLSDKSQTMLRDFRRVNFAYTT